MINILLGSLPLTSFIAAMIFALIGFGLQKRLSYNKGKDSKRTPKEFSWKFWFKDNWDDILLQFAIIFVIVRFAPDLLLYVYPDAVVFFERADTMAIYLVLGFLSTRITKVIKSKGK
jgi:hypothetical protein